MTKKQIDIEKIDYKLKEVLKSTFKFDRPKDSLIVDNQKNDLMIEFEDIKIIMKPGKSQIQTLNILKEALNLIILKR